MCGGLPSSSFAQSGMANKHLSQGCFNESGADQKKDRKQAHLKPGGLPTSHDICSLPKISKRKAPKWPEAKLAATWLVEGLPVLVRILSADICRLELSHDTRAPQLHLVYLSWLEST